ncbi:MAG: putative DNA binding domain-containing protein [Muribaculaceae bacterium]|nr:putative DNA binding domain-containing protein [Muribaculaceae bacterium]
MLTRKDILRLRYDKETSRVERTTSTGDMDKFQETICAFSNDMANSRKPGYLLIGVKDNGDLSGLKVDDKLFIKISSIRSSGNILPLPTMTTETYEFEDGDVLVVEVQPSLFPPVRYRGRTFIRIGPRRDIASEAEERILTERRIAYMPTFDTTPCFQASLKDINLKAFKDIYLQRAIPAIVRKKDKRTPVEQMGALGLYDLEHDRPTFGAVALFGFNPRKFMPGLYVQFVRFKGKDKTSEVEDERQFEGGYVEMLPHLEAFLEMSVVKKKPIPVSLLREELIVNYPYWALRELLLNALLHRDMQGNGPIRIYEFENRVEIMNPGGLFGNARPENFPNVNDYRNPLLASAFKTLGYVNMFNRGVSEVQKQLLENGNEPAVFNVDNLTAFEVTIFNRKKSKVKGSKLKGASRGVLSQGVPSQGVPSQGVPSQGVPSQGVPSQGVPSQGVPSQGVPSQGVPSQGVPSQGVPSQGVPSQGVPSQGVPSQRRMTEGTRIVCDRIIEFCSEPRSLKEIAEFLGVKAFKRVKARYLDFLLKDGKIVMTIPDKPTSSNQKYISVNQA